MEAAIETRARIGAGAEPIESIDWLREFGERYTQAWNALDPRAVAACTHPEVRWIDPALPEPVHGRDGVAGFVEESARAFPDLQFTEPGPPAIADDSLAAYIPWEMAGTNTGPIDPPGLPPTGRRMSIRGIDVWQFREGLIWRYEAIYDFADVGRQLGLMPARGSRAESLMIGARKLRARLPI